MAAHRYNIIHVYRSQYESGGILWHSIFHQIMTALLLFQLTMAGVLSAKGYGGPTHPPPPPLPPPRWPTHRHHLTIIIINSFRRGAESGGLLALPLFSGLFWIWVQKKFSTAARYGPIDGVHTRLMDAPYVTTHSPHTFIAPFFLSYLFI